MYPTWGGGNINEASVYDFSKFNILSLKVWISDNKKKMDKSELRDEIKYRIHDIEQEIERIEQERKLILKMPSRIDRMDNVSKIGFNVIIGMDPNVRSVYNNMNHYEVDNIAKKGFYMHTLDDAKRELLKSIDYLNKELKKL